MARELAEQLLVLAQRLQDPVYLIELPGTGEYALLAGRVCPARVYLERLPSTTSSSTALWHSCMGRIRRSFASPMRPGRCGCLAIRTRPAGEAPRRSRWPRSLSHSPSLAVALPWASYLHQSCREVLLVQERAEALMGLAAEQGFQWWLAVGTIRRDCIGRAGETGRRRDGPAAPGAGRLLDHRGRAGTDVLACPPG